LYILSTEYARKRIFFEVEKKTQDTFKFQVNFIYLSDKIIRSSESFLFHWKRFQVSIFVFYSNFLIAGIFLYNERKGRFDDITYRNWWYIKIWWHLKMLQYTIDPYNEATKRVSMSSVYSFDVLIFQYVTNFF
jgi:hypothetical protein